MKRSGSVLLSWFTSSTGAEAHGGRWIYRQAQIEEKTVSVEVGAGLLPSAEHWTDSTSQQTFFCGCADEKECAHSTDGGVPPVRLAQVVVG